MVNGVKGLSIAWLSTTDLTNMNSGEGGTNVVDIKKYQSQGQEYPYVSGQAMRRYLKEGVRRLCEGQDCCFPNDKGETCGDICGCVLCDLFGFMTTIKDKGAAVRVSPVKVAPAMGLLPFDRNSNIDFLTRRKPSGSEEMKGDIVNVELGCNLYKCGMAIDLRAVGAKETYDEKNKRMEFTDIVCGEKSTRLKYLLESLVNLADQSKQSRLLTDFSPDVVCIAFQQRYSHRLQKLFAVKNSQPVLDVERLKQILAQVKSDSVAIYMGIISGIIENQDDVIAAFKDAGITVTTPHEALNSAISQL